MTGVRHGTPTSITASGAANSANTVVLSDTSNTAAIVADDLVDTLVEFAGTIGGGGPSNVVATLDLA